MEDNDNPVDNAANDSDSAWTGIDEFIANIKPKDIKDFTDQILTFLKQNAEAKEKLHRRQLAVQIINARHRVKMVRHYQWIRFALIIACSSAVTFLIYIDKFSSAAALFFGGIIAYLFGRQPR